MLDAPGIQNLQPATQEEIARPTGPQPGEIWRHYKGGLYVIVCRSMSEEGNHPLVTYRSNLTGECWTRKLSNFTGMVRYDSILAYPVLRFSKVYG